MSKTGARAYHDDHSADGTPLEPAASAKYDVRLDDSTGIVHVTNTGLWEPDDVAPYIADLSRVFAESRRRRRNILMLADLRGYAIQRPEVAKLISDGGAPLHLEGDRHAILVESSLMKMQLRRTLPTDMFQSFLSPEAASKWLLAWR
jgi:hypothetical protein